MNQMAGHNKTKDSRLAFPESGEQSRGRKIGSCYLDGMEGLGLLSLGSAHLSCVISPVISSLGHWFPACHTLSCLLLAHVVSALLPSPSLL